MTYIFLIILAILLAVIFVLKEQLSDKKEVAYLPYVKRNYLMSKAEHEFFKVLQQVVQDKYYIVPQVQLSKIVDVNKYEKMKQTYRNKIDRKSVDFVLFEKEYFTPYLVIELDDSSHLLPDREKRDDFLNKVLGKAGINFEHIKTSFSYDFTSLSDRIFKS